MAKRIRLKKLAEQVIVLTGASSGIGLVTARKAAERGARLVLAARSGDELRELAEEIAGRGGDVAAVEADVSREEDVQRIADAAVERFGGFDTWVNNAGVTIFGRLEDVFLADQRRLFETNFWGLVYGSLTAVAHLRQRGGGALINMGSIASDRAIPLQGIYAASKHAVKGFTDALRMELEEEGAPISVTLIKPTSIATPLPRHGKNYLESEPTLPPPVYAPENVARAILHCAERPERDVFIGGGARMMAVAEMISPRLTDKWMERSMFREMETGEPARGDRRGTLDRPSHDLEERMEYPRHVFETSAYTEARLHPLAAGAALVGAGLAVGGLWAAVAAARA